MIQKSSVNHDPINLTALIWLLYNPVNAVKGMEIIRRIDSKVHLSKVVIVWNGGGILPLNVSAFKLDRTVIDVVKGGNHGREFGGYQDGLDSLGEDRNLGVFFLNDTAGVHNYLPNYFYGALVSSALKYSDGEGICVGHIDRALQVLEIAGLKSEAWVRSNIFYLNSAALRSLNYKIYSPEINDLVLGESVEGFFSKSLPQAMQKRIARWLFEPGSRSWYAAAPLTKENVNFMAGKARAILQEYYLSMRILHAGNKILRPDMNLIKFFWFKFINRIGINLGILK